MPPKNTLIKAGIEKSSDEQRPKCGIIMPISAIDGLPPSHWEDVKDILIQAIETAGFEADLVSEAEEITIIHKTIIHNLYNNPIVVCDVSGKNPNVMFELGIRLTFDKATVVVKDDQTNYSFDMSPIEHLTYPRDLRFNQILQFKDKLSAKVRSTHDLALSDHNYSTFLKHFGQFTVPKLDQTEVSADQFIIKRLDELTQSMNKLERAAGSGRTRPQADTKFDPSVRTVDFRVLPEYRELLRTKLRQLIDEYPELALNMAGNRARVYVPAAVAPEVIWQLDNIRLMFGAQSAPQKENEETSAE